MLITFTIGYIAGTLAALLLIGLLRAAKKSATAEDTSRAMSG